MRLQHIRLGGGTPPRGGIVIVPRRLRVERTDRVDTIVYRRRGLRGKLGGGGLLETPAPKNTQLNEIRFEPFYRVILEYTLWNDNRVVAEKVVQAIPGIGKNNAERCVKIAKAHGSSILLTTTREAAEGCVQRLGVFGLKGFIEEA